MPGKLYLIPSLLSSHPPEWSHPPEVIRIIHSIRYFAVEKLHPAVLFLKRIDHPEPEFKMEFYPLDKRVTAEQLSDIVRILQQGHDVGVISEAGCPGIADPGAELVWMCHLRGISVEVMVGPSAILLSMMGSGMNGQSFAFNGYLPVAEESRALRIKELQNRSAREDQTQLFIEAPHRNQELLDTLLQTLNSDTKLGVCWNLLAEDQRIVSKNVSDWVTGVFGDDFIRKPAMFLYQAQSLGSLDKRASSASQGELSEQNLSSRDRYTGDSKARNNRTLKSGNSGYQRKKKR